MWQWEKRSILNQLNNMILKPQSFKTLQSNYLYVLVNAGAKPHAEMCWKFHKPVLRNKLIYINDCLVFIHKPLTNKSKVNFIHIFNIPLIEKLFKQKSIKSLSLGFKKTLDLIPYISDKMDLKKGENNKITKSQNYFWGRTFGYPDICCKIFCKEMNKYYQNGKDKAALRKDRVFIKSKVSDWVTIVAYKNAPTSIKEAKIMITFWDRIYLKLR
jgi:hypothetical protein